MLWFSFKLGETNSMVIEMPTTVINIPDGQALAARPPETVRVQVEGEGYQLFQLVFDPPIIPIDASVGQLVLEDATIDLPKNVALQSTFPRIVNVQTEPRIDRKVPVRLRASIDVPATHDYVAPPRFSPDSVLISGARSIVNAFDAWPTETIHLRAVKDSLRVQVPLADTLNGLLRTDTEAVTLTAYIEEFAEETREIDVIVTDEPTNEKLVSLEPQHIVVRYRVPLSQHDQVQEARDFFATVSFGELRADTTGRITPEVHPPVDLVLHDLKIDSPPLRYYINLVGD